MTGFAANTAVSVERSKAELDTLLSKNGASSRGIASDDEAGQVQVIFALGGGHYRLHIPLPKLGDFPGRTLPAPRGWDEWDHARRLDWRQKQWEQASRTRWRTLILLVKSKLEIVRLGLSTAQREFMADLVLSNGKTVGEMLASDAGKRLLAQTNETRDDA